MALEFNSHDIPKGHDLQRHYLISGGINIMLPTQLSFSYKPFRIALFLFLLLHLGIISIFAQSGRNKSTPNKPSPTTPQPSPAPEKKEEAVKPPNNQDSGIRILVVFYRPIITNSGIFSQIVTRGCLERLQQSTLLKAGAGAEMNRKEAYDFAKASKDTYVLWFQLQSDFGDSDNLNNRSVPSVVDFVLFIPETGKTKTSGHVYTRQREDCLDFSSQSTIFYW